ncbi:cell wall-binding repeat-containing protein [Agromyces kandeliae]|uniref:cell wall-binding repeat-containing protein n=1 Tax=Agromyces kandeliae TaxID=2666141 RepID=UPI0018A1BD98|nr:cell wall-binding repeat-containing protein [Agromyces kandeliae]
MTLQTREGYGVSHLGGQVGADGTYSMTGIEPGEYVVAFIPRLRSYANDQQRLDHQGSHGTFWGGTPYRSQAAALVLSEGMSKTGIDGVLPEAGSISGVITGPDDGPVAGAWMEFRFAANRRLGLENDDTVLLPWPTTDEHGRYTIRQLPPGDWAVGVRLQEGSSLREEAYSDKVYYPEGDKVRVSGASDVTGIDVKLTTVAQTGPFGVVSRIAGPDRYATAVEISRASFPDGASVAFIASGRGYADALSGAPLAAMSDGPILLTSPTSIPSSVRTELDRLNPERIVVLGGPVAIASSVETELARLTRGSVTRLAGSDRYETSAVIAQQWVGGARHVYLASGTSFPDALSGAPAAAIEGSPILLTGRTGVPAAIMRETRRLEPVWAYFLGGTAVIDSQVMGAIQSDGGVDLTLYRGGADRYDTSVQQSSDLQPGIEVAYIASGSDFPDALAGAAVAGRTGAPILLTARDSLPSVVEQELRRLRPEQIVILGGESVISRGIQAELERIGTSG